jgi:hypothetical protein
MIGLFFQDWDGGSGDAWMASIAPSVEAAIAVRWDSVSCLRQRLRRGQYGHANAVFAAPMALA